MKLLINLKENTSESV